MTAALYRQLKIRRDTKANIPVLAEGELFFCTDSVELFVGQLSGVNKKMDITYDPLNDSYWSGSPPDNLISAMDRVAAAVSGLLGGPIP